MALQDILQALSGSNRFTQFPASSNSQPDQTDQQDSADSFPGAGSMPPSPPSRPSNPPPPQIAQRQTQGIKGYMADFFYQGFEGAKSALGMQTDFQKQQAQQKLDLERQRTQAEVMDKQSEATYRQNQTVMNAPQPVLDPQEAESLGVKVGDMISPATKLALMKANLQYKGTLARANATVSAAAMRAMAVNQKVTMRAAYMPDGSLGVGLYNRLGQFQGYADNAAIPAEYMEHIKQGQELKFDSDGNLQRVPVTSTSQPLVPPPPKPNQLRDSTPQPQQGTPQNINNAPAPPNPSNIKGSLQQGAAKAVTNAKPVMSDGKPFQGPTAADVGYAIDPRTNQMTFVTRGEAATNGQKEFAKVSAPQMRKDQSIVNNVADIQRKFGDYADTFNEGDLDANDKQAIAYLMDHNIGAGLSTHGMSVNLMPGYIKSQLRAKAGMALGDLGARRYILYNQAKEALAYMQQAKTGASRFTDAINQLHFDQLASPLDNPDLAKQTHSLFQQNIDYVAHGLPQFPNIKDTQQTVKAAQDQRISSRNIANQKSATAEPPRPAHVPAGYVFKPNGPKGAGWYKP